MATVTKLILSGSTNGKNILVAGTTPGTATPIHTTPSGTTSIDEVWLYAANNATSSMTCSILWGEVTTPQGLTQVILNPVSGRTLIMDGKLLQNGLSASVYTNVANLMVVDGFINRYTT